MSLIGPRPELIKYTNAYEGEEKDILQMIRKKARHY